MSMAPNNNGYGGVVQSTLSSSHHSTSHGNRGSINNQSTIISSKPTLITTPHLRFLIMDAPRQSNLHLYIKECRRNYVTDIVRVCEPTYLGNELTNARNALHIFSLEMEETGRSGS